MFVYACFTFLFPVKSFVIIILYYFDVFVDGVGCDGGRGWIQGRSLLLLGRIVELGIGRNSRMLRVMR